MAKHVRLWLLAPALVLASAVCPADDIPTHDARLHIGTAVTSEVFASWNITVFRDGAGLPPGSGNAVAGEKTFELHCARCHGPLGTRYIGGNQHRNYPSLWGGKGTLNTGEPVQTIGSYWPYATSVFDYIQRAMPFWNPKTMSDNDIYGLTAYLLFRNEIIDKETIIDKNVLHRINMPNRYGFVQTDPRPDTQAVRCMQDCPPIKAPGILKAR